ncbi:MAG: hypothetical protein Q9179_000459 [Wetmoreana sp. 5 TL-2023]
MYSLLQSAIRYAKSKITHDGQQIDRRLAPDELPFEFEGTGRDKGYFIDVQETPPGVLTWDKLSNVMKGLLRCAFNRQLYRAIVFEVWEETPQSTRQQLGFGIFGTLTPNSVQRNEGHDAPRCSQGLEYGVRIETVMAVALFYPEPVPKGQRCTQAQCLTERDGPRRRKKQIIDGEKNGGGGMEAQIRQQAQLEFLGNDQLFVDGYQSAVQSADEDFQRRCDHGESILYPEEALRGGDVGQGA